MHGVPGLADTVVDHAAMGSRRTRRSMGLTKRITAITDKVAPADMPDIIEQSMAYDLNDFDRFVGELVRRAKAWSAR